MSKKTNSATKIALMMGVSLLAASQAFAQEAVTTEAKGEVVTILGSRIKRINKEGPAPVSVISAEAIVAGGYASVPDVLKSVTQNGGMTQSQQSYGGAITTPGASQVDLRGLGPNHTLVMIDGKRVADFPMPYQGLSNFADVSNIPVSMIERIEVLSGSASAIYGSDAVAGVINFTLKKKPDGTSFSYRYGGTEHGGNESSLFSFSTGYEKDKFSIVYGLEVQDKLPLWQYERDIQDSTLDAPTSRRRRAQYVFARYDWDTEIGIDPGSACSAMSSLARGTLIRTTDRFGDPYCGSHEAVSFGTITSQKKAVNNFAALNYYLNDTTSLYANIQMGQSDTKLMNDVTYWKPQLPDGSTTAFHNAYTGLNETWERIFMPEEAGSMEAFMTKNHSKTLTITPGIKGEFGDWSYDLGGNFSKYTSRIGIMQTIASLANNYFLGPQLGIDADSGLPIYNANPAKFFTALTPTQWASISDRATTRAEAETKGISLTLTKPALFKLPAGDVGFAAIAELNHQAYSVIPEANATDFGYYYGYAATSGEGSRDHGAIGAEMKLPLLTSMELNVAARYDGFKFAGSDIGKATYNVGLEYRPLPDFLLRAAYGTGFRAPDLHYVFAELDLFHPSVNDYYACYLDDGEDCSDYEVDILKHREGSKDLKPETSTSFNAGFMWQPSKYFDISLDYFKIDMKDQVQDLSLDSLLRAEADCRIGGLSTPTCVDALARVHRDGDGEITYVYINPINVSEESTDGIDIEARATIPSSFGTFKFVAGHTEVFNHTSVQYVGDPELDQLAVDSGYTIPAQKSKVSIGYEKGPFSITFTGNRLGEMQNFAEDAFIKASWSYNANVRYDINDKTQLSLSVNNLLDTDPVKDDTWSSYPYYNSSWFDSIGRAYFIELSHKF